MRRLISERPGVIGAYVLVIVVAAIALQVNRVQLQHVQQHDERKFCELVLTIAADPPPPPPGATDYDLARARQSTERRQEQRHLLIGGRTSCR